MVELLKGWIIFFVEKILQLFKMPKKIFPSYLIYENSSIANVLI